MNDAWLAELAAEATYRDYGATTPRPAPQSPGLQAWAVIDNTSISRNLFHTATTSQTSIFNIPGCALRDYQTQRSQAEPSTGWSFDLGAFEEPATVPVPTTPLTVAAVQTDLNNNDSEPAVAPLAYFEASSILQVEPQPAAQDEIIQDAFPQSFQFNLWIPINLEDRQFKSVNQFHRFINLFCRGQIGNGVSDNGPTGWAMTRLNTHHGNEAHFICVCGIRAGPSQVPKPPPKTTRKRKRDPRKCV